MRFRDRFDAGEQLAARLGAYAHRSDVLVLALPRGGVPVGFPIACALRAPLDVWVVRKLGAVRMPELAVGAIASGGVQYVDANLVRHLHMSPEQIEAIAARERGELERREEAYRGGRPPVDVGGKAVLLVDDGVATGSTMRAGIAALRSRNPTQVAVAVPVAAQRVCEILSSEADAVYRLFAPQDLDSVGQWYDDFSQTSDEEVRALLARANRGEEAPVEPASPPRADR